MWSFSKTNIFLLLIMDYTYSSKIKVLSLSEGKHTIYPLHHQAKNVNKLSCILTLYILCIMFIELFLCIILCILDDILIISPMHFSVPWHHRQGAQFIFKFFETHQMITSTCWPHATRSHFFTQNIQLLSQNVFTDVYVYWNSSKFKSVFTQTAPLRISLKCLHWCICL
jgi:hypothetical protein